MNDKQEEKRDMKALKIIWLFSIIGILNACTADDIVSSDSNGRDENAATEIAVSLDDLLPINMNSRDTNIDGLLSQINDLNIRVKVGGKNTFIYCPSKDELYIDGKSVTSTKTYYIDRNMLNIHCNDISAKQVEQVEVIANNGEMILKDDIWKNVVEQGDDNLNNGYCMMYGSTVASQDNKHDGEQGALDCRLFTVKLQRTRAMLTVQLNGEGLKEGVTITPKKISLHNVPTQCTLLSDNVATTTKNGKAHDIDWGTITQGKTVGAHNNSGLEDNFLPLYLFENLQGVNDNTSSSQKVTKYPQGCSNVADARNNKTHSYVEIEAGYKYEDGQILKNSGTIVYRFFLGENDYNDFNVKRNTYYRLTLNLKGFGGASEDGKVEDGKLVVNEKDLSWRVDMDIRDWGFEKDEYDFDAHAVMGEIAVMGEGWKLTSMTGAETGSSWLRFKSEKYGTAGWAEPTDNNIQGEDGKIIFYIQPMQEWEFENYGEKRTITLTIQKGADKQTITISQWSPIKINNEIWMERFEEDDCIQTWGFSDINVENRTIKLNGKDRKYVTGIDIATTKEIGNTHYGYQSETDAAHAYCYKKGGSGISGSPAGSTAEPYCLPDQRTFELLFEYSKNNPEGKFDPIREYDDYWTSSVLSKKGTETQYWSGSTSTFEGTNIRNGKKRVRAVYIGQIYD